MKVLYLPNELGDGQSREAISVSQISMAITRRLADWAEQAEPGESITFDIGEMTADQLWTQRGI